ncbi:MAG: electron transport complex subunit RsxE, partial [Bacteroidales bacterium]|nr:electron transport complex subunit RsxE [Bacteroidales bacterium]
AIRLPVFIIIIASFTTIVQLVLQAYVTSLYNALGVFIPLIVVNCIVLGRAEAFASKNGVWASCVDGLGMGLGYALALMILGAVREVLGSLSIFGWQFIQADGILVFVLAPGAFFGLAYFIAVVRRFNK